MLIEMCAWQLRPGMMAKLEPLLEAAVNTRTKVSRLGGIWRTDLGVINRIVSLWPYESTTEREDVRANVDTSAWRDALDEFIIEEDSKLLRAAPFAPPLGPREIGHVYEIRSYTYRTGGLTDVFEGWGPAIGQRAQLSPFIGAWYTDVGPLNMWVHIWAYKDMTDRERVRLEATSKGLWPPKNKPGTFVRQEAILATPFRFSPLR
jgi:hypothetical protein